jgi:hypothetical protein
MLKEEPMAYEDMPISAAHRAALEAGTEAFGPDDRFELPRTDVFKSAGPGLCDAYRDAADTAYAAAREAAFSGSHAEWIAAMAEASLWSHALTQCLMATIYTKKEVFG